MSIHFNPTSPYQENSLPLDEGQQTSSDLDRGPSVPDLSEKPGGARLERTPACGDLRQLDPSLFSQNGSNSTQDTSDRG